MSRLHGVFSCFVVFLAGCSFTSTVTPSLDVAPDGIHGQVFGGQQPVTSATVNIYEVGSTAYGTASTTAKGFATTDANGNFTFPTSGTGSYTCTASNTPMYLVVKGGTAGGFSANANLGLMALIPACQTGRTSTIVINEVTTAAAVLAAGQFMNLAFGASSTLQIGATCQGCAAGTYNKGLVSAFNITYPMLVSNATGQAALSGTTNGITITRESSKLYSFANTLAACVNSNGATSTTETTSICGKLFTGVNATSASPRPSNTIQAALAMSRYPYYNVSTVYGLGSSTPPFSGLSTTPNDWTVGISYTTSNFGLGIQWKTTATIDIDASGNIWFPSNKSGAIGIGEFSPSTTTFTGPTTGAGLTYPQFVAVDTSVPAYAWTADESSNKVVGVPTTTGSVKTFTGGFTTSGPVAVDTANQVIFASTASPYKQYFLDTGRTTLAATSLAALAGPASWLVDDPFNGDGYNNGIMVGLTTTECRLDYDYVTDTNNVSTGTSACVAGSGNSFVGGGQAAVNAGNAGSVFSIVAEPTSTNSLCYAGSSAACTAFATLNVPTGIVVDGNDVFWAVNSGNASIAAFSPNFAFPDPFTITYAPVATGIAYLHGTGNGGTATTPYAIAIDGSGNVWLANADCVATSATHCSATSFTLSEIVGVAVPAITPRTSAASNSLANSDAISPLQ